MKDAYPELGETAERVSKAILAEETRFAHTMSFGMANLEQEADRTRMDKISSLLDELDEEKPEYREKVSDAFKRGINAGNNFETLFRDVERFFGRERSELFRRDWQDAQVIPRQLSGRQAFDIFQTYGLPRDFIEDFCRDSGIPFDASGFELALKEERDRARASWKGAAKQTANPVYQQLPKSVFEGYWQTR